MTTEALSTSGAADDVEPEAGSIKPIASSERTAADHHPGPTTAPGSVKGAADEEAVSLVGISCVRAPSIGHGTAIVISKNHYLGGCRYRNHAIVSMILRTWCANFGCYGRS